MHEVRLDSAHTPLPQKEIGGEPLEQMIRAVTGQDPQALANQVQRHASEIAAHLQQHQAELDRRQEELNARLAMMEQDARKARMLLCENERALDEAKVVSIDENTSPRHDVGAGQQPFSTRQSNDQLDPDPSLATAGSPIQQPRSRWRQWLERQRGGKVALETDLPSFSEAASGRPESSLRPSIDVDGDDLPGTRLEATAYQDDTGDAVSRTARLDKEWSEKYAALARWKDALSSQQSRVDALFAQT